ncbi:Bac_Flav_fam_1, Bacteroidetes-specific putative membrane protein [Flavobacteriaceae bacterium]
MKNTLLPALLMLLTFLDATAQQDPHYTQYMYNMNVINPAYAGSKENLSFGLLYRKQWIEIEDAPTTFSLSGSAPIGKNVGLGLSVISDKIGPVQENNVYGDFSYTLNLGGEHRLALGLKAGVTFQKIGLFSQIGDGYVVDLGDPSFAEDTNSSNLNIGTGLFYYTNKYYVSFSIPNMLKSAHLDYDGVKYGTEIQHYFLTGGYVFDLNPNLKFKPFAMVKSALNAPTSLDVSANFLYVEKFEMGATYRLQDSFGVMVNYAVSPSLRIGYAYDHIVSDLKVTTPSSHEIILLFDLNFPKKVSQSPRFF